MVLGYHHRTLTISGQLRILSVDPWLAQFAPAHPLAAQAPAPLAPAPLAGSAGLAAPEKRSCEAGLPGMVGELIPRNGGFHGGTPKSLGDL